MYSNEIIDLALNEINLEIDEVIIKGEFIRCGKSEWLLLDDLMAYNKTKSYIKDSISSFKAEFLSDMTGYKEDELTQLTSEFENDSETILSIVENSCGLDNFVLEAIKADGRGHFLSSYDGIEIEIKSNDEVYYLYRTN